jgi:hypothetical protein
MGETMKDLERFFIYLFICIATSSILNAEPVSQNRESLNSRRTYLNWHQGLGLAAWGSWLATNIAGEAKYNEDKNFYKLRDTLPSQILTSYLIEPSNDKLLLYTITKNYHEEGTSEHGKLAYLTVGLYSASAYLAFMAPGKIDDTRTEGWSTIFTHKAMIFVHLPAMLALPSLGQKLEHGSAQDLENMRNVGWLGFSALTISIASFYF